MSNIEDFVNQPYQTIVRADKRGDTPTFMAYHPELEGCKASGETWQEAIKNLDEARRAYIIASLKYKLPIPTAKFTTSSISRNTILLQQNEVPFHYLPITKNLIAA